MMSMITMGDRSFREIYQWSLADDDILCIWLCSVTDILYILSTNRIWQMTRYGHRSLVYEFDSFLSNEMKVHALTVVPSHGHNDIYVGGNNGVLHLKRSESKRDMLMTTLAPVLVTDLITLIIHYYQPFDVVKVPLYNRDGTLAEWHDVYGICCTSSHVYVTQPGMIARLDLVPPTAIAVATSTTCVSSPSSSCSGTGSFIPSNVFMEWVYEHKPVKSPLYGIGVNHDTNEVYAGNGWGSIHRAAEGGSVYSLSAGPRGPRPRTVGIVVVDHRRISSTPSTSSPSAPSLTSTTTINPTPTITTTPASGVTPSLYPVVYVECPLGTIRQQIHTKPVTVTRYGSAAKADINRCSPRALTISASTARMVWMSMTGRFMDSFDENGRPLPECAPPTGPTINLPSDPLHGLHTDPMNDMF